VFAEDRVLVGVINRKADLRLLLEKRQYRVPVRRMPDGVNADVLAFFISRPVRSRSAIYHYAGLRGVELQRRVDILPSERHHPRANDLYWLCQLDVIRDTQPPIVNGARQTIAFIYTTWDRFADAVTVRDLYVDSPYYVSRVYYALPRRVAL
jgi:hypothetical protein